MLHVEQTVRGWPKISIHMDKWNKLGQHGPKLVTLHESMGTYIIFISIVIEGRGVHI